uniref:Uncharacterized protein n=1 Tax=Arundo donax TaxID=35708 RepID=A0A0A8ZFA3_ARUDO
MSQAHQRSEAKWRAFVGHVTGSAIAQLWALH